MSKVAKYRRQVSEDPDIDSLLSTLSPEEMEELEKELDVVDADGSIPLELQQENPTENSAPNCDATLNHCEKETRKRLQREQSIDVSCISPRRAASRGGNTCELRWGGIGMRWKTGMLRQALAKEEELWCRDQRSEAGTCSRHSGREQGVPCSPGVTEPRAVLVQGVSPCGGQQWCNDSDPLGCLALSFCIFSLWISLDS